MVHFTVQFALRGSPLFFDVLLANVAATITQLKTGATTWQTFIIDSNNGTVLNTATTTGIQSFTYKYP